MTNNLELGQDVDDFTVARATKFISKIVNDDLASCLDNPYRGFALMDMGTAEEWSEILTPRSRPVPDRANRAKPRVRVWTRSTPRRLRAGRR